MVGRVERDGDGAEAQDAEVGGAPAGVVAGEDGAPIARTDAARAEPGGRARGHVLQLAVAHDLQPVAPLDLDGRAIGEADGRRGELLVEVVHSGDRPAREQHSPAAWPRQAGGRGRRLRRPGESGHTDLFHTLHAGDGP